MSDYPSDLRYTKDHEWVRKGSDGVMTVGITKFAANQLGDAVFVELPKVGQTLDEGEAFGTVESVKAVSELFMPMGGEITAVNEGLGDDPELVNTDCYGEGWMVRLRPSDKKEYDNLLTAAKYADWVKQEE
jgi:glycine cleavage system H protein